MKVRFYLAITISLLFLLVPELSFAATEHATFESLYSEASTVGWVIAGLMAIVAGATIVLTGGIASPIVVGIGSWVGGLMGLSGVAATNAGLALLGGGAIASGGFGMIGGTVLITAALSFSTDIVVDYTVGSAVSKYSYSQLEEDSKGLLTLPVPVNGSGSNSYEKAIEILGGINKKAPISNNSNQQIVRKAIAALSSETEALEIGGLLKNETLMSLLYFISNDYPNAKKHANSAIKYGRVAKLRRTLPAYLYATSSLYEENFNFTDLTENYFRYSVLAESDNPLIPLLFSVYLDRSLLRSNDGFLDEANILNIIFKVMKSPDLKDYYLQNYTIILSRYFIQLKLDQQKIAFLATSTNPKLKGSPKTLAVVDKSFDEYNELLKGAEVVMNEMLSLPSVDEENRAKIIEFHTLLLKYLRDKHRLESLASKLKVTQKPLKTEGLSNLFIIGVGLLLLIVVFRLTRARTSEEKKESIDSNVATLGHKPNKTS